MYEKGFGVNDLPNQTHYVAKVSLYPFSMRWLQLKISIKFLPPKTNNLNIINKKSQSNCITRKLRDCSKNIQWSIEDLLMSDSNIERSIIWHSLCDVFMISQIRFWPPSDLMLHVNLCWCFVVNIFSGSTSKAFQKCVSLVNVSNIIFHYGANVSLTRKHQHWWLTMEDETMTLIWQMDHAEYFHATSKEIKRKFSHSHCERKYNASQYHQGRKWYPASMGLKENILDFVIWNASRSPS